MKSLQIMYPNTSNVILDNVLYVQIGIERPHSIPLSELIDFAAIVMINGKRYSITDRDILEFGNFELTKSKLDLRILDINNPYLIIDLAYETAD